MLLVACPEGIAGVADWLNINNSFPNIAAGLGREKTSFNRSPAIPLNPKEQIVYKYTVRGASKDLINLENSKYKKKIAEIAAIP